MCINILEDPAATVLTPLFFLPWSPKLHCHQTTWCHTQEGCELHIYVEFSI